MVNLFAYGSLMCTDIMALVCGKQYEHQEGTLRGFFRSRIHHVNYPAIHPQSDSKVEGVIYYDLSAEAIAQLDAFEGEYYRREEATIYSADGAEITAMVYVISPDYQHLLTGEQWSYENFLTKEKDNFMEQYFGFNVISPS